MPAGTTFSAWLMARGEIQFAKLLKNYKVDDFDSALDVRDFIMRIVNNARRDKSKGVVPAFDEAFCRDENCISRLGDGSVAGRAGGSFSSGAFSRISIFPNTFGESKSRYPGPPSSESTNSNVSWNPMVYGPSRTTKPGTRKSGGAFSYRHSRSSSSES